MKCKDSNIHWRIANYLNILCISLLHINNQNKLFYLKHIDE